MYDPKIDYSEKLHALRSYLIWKKQIRFDSDIYKPLKIDSGQFRRFISGEEKPSENQISKIENQFNVDLSKFDFIHEVTKDLKEFSTYRVDPDEQRLTLLAADIIPETFTQDDDAGKLYELYEHYTAAGGLETFNEDAPRDPLGYIRLPHVYDWDLHRIVYNDSMEPTIRQGSHILGKRIYSFREVRWGEIYNVSTVEQEVVKRIDEHADKEFVWLISDNTKYRPWALHRSQILKLHFVRQIIPPPIE